MNTAPTVEKPKCPYSEQEVLNFGGQDGSTHRFSLQSFC